MLIPTKLNTAYISDVEIIPWHDQYRARGILQIDKGERTDIYAKTQLRTSVIEHIDIAKGLIFTKNSVYAIIKVEDVETMKLILGATS